MKTYRKRHLICEKMPFVAMILTMLITTFAIAMFSSSSGKASGYLIESAACLVLIWIFKLWFAPDYNGSFKPGVTIKELLLICLPYVIRIILDSVYTGVVNDWFFKPTFISFCMAVSAGIVEESMFRAFTLPIGMRYVKSEKRAYMVVAIISLIFGLSHLANLSSGNPAMIIVQTFTTFFESIFFCALYLRSGSIIPTMILHGVYDWTCFVLDPTLENGIPVAEIDAGIIFSILFALSMGIVGLYLIRPSMQERILKLWNEKWNVHDGGDGET